MWSHVRNACLAVVVAAVASSGMFSCAAAPSDPDSEELIEDVGTQGEGVSGSLAVGTELVATANVNLRKDATTSSGVIYTIAEGSKVTVEQSSPKNGFYKIKHNGTIGWSYGQYYEPTGGSSGNVATTTLTATSDVNLRKGPSTSYAVLTVVPTGASVKVVNPTPDNGFYNIDYNGTVGWSSGKYYTDGASSGGGSGGGSGGSSTKADAAMTRAESAVGFSYWWGHGRFNPSGVTSGTKGSCSGSCPNCSHSGSWGGDCSGLAAKVWQVPSSNTDLTVDSHPYSTANFNEDTSQWSTVSRSNVKKADAMVYRSGGAGHIFMYSKGDGWGSMYAYECRGCSAGCIKGYRTASSSYHAIRRAGY
ncbi:MAG: SH3 domain-containing protein [Polyangiaceae bacterium]